MLNLERILAQDRLMRAMTGLNDYALKVHRLRKGLKAPVTSLLPHSHSSIKLSLSSFDGFR
jgi:hypothetical protein